MGKVSGFVFEADGEPTLYWTGDTIWYLRLQQVIDQTQPANHRHALLRALEGSAPIATDAI